MCSPYYNDVVFGTLDELTDWVKNIAYNLGYVIVKQRSKKARDVVNKAYLMCNRGGHYKATSESTTHSGTIKIGCPFQLVAKRNVRGGRKIQVKCDEHNHEPAQWFEGHAYAKRLTNEEFALVEEMTLLGVPPREILITLKEKNSANVSTIETIYDAQKKIRMAQKIECTPMQLLMKSLNNGGYIHHVRAESNTNQVQDLFFIHPDLVEIWHAFPHVLILDATYKTNRFYLPFIQIVGLTSTNKTFCIVFTLIQREKTDNFKWVLNCLRQTLDGHMFPRVIVTDRELALIEACRCIFPNATRLLCRFHIHENIKRHCRQSFKSEDKWEKFKSRWNYLVGSPTIKDYEKNLVYLHSKLKANHQNVYNHVYEQWLKNHKEMFVSTWIDQHLNFGERTINRVESQHALFKRHITSNKPPLDKFVKVIDDKVRLQCTQMKATFEEIRKKIKHRHNNKTFALLLNNVSLEALDILSGEQKRIQDMKDKNKACSRRIRRSCGLPCACEIQSYVVGSKSIPLDSIDSFWKKLDFSPALLCPEEAEIAFHE